MRLRDSLYLVLHEASFQNNILSGLHPLDGSLALGVFPELRRGLDDSLVPVAGTYPAAARIAEIQNGGITPEEVRLGLLLGSAGA